MGCRKTVTADKSYLCVRLSVLKRLNARRSNDVDEISMAVLELHRHPRERKCRMGRCKLECWDKWVVASEREI